MPNLRKLSTYDADGLACSHRHQLTSYGKSPSQTCAWYLYVKNNHWVLNPNNGKPKISKVIPDQPLPVTSSRRAPRFGKLTPLRSPGQMETGTRRDKDSSAQTSRSPLTHR